jgi:hypothetical protein
MADLWEYCFIEEVLGSKDILAIYQSPEGVRRVRYGLQKQDNAEFKQWEKDVMASGMRGYPRDYPRMFITEKLITYLLANGWEYYLDDTKKLRRKYT